MMKPQYVDHIPRTAKGSVGTYMDTKGKGHGERAAELMTTLQLDHVRDRDVRSRALSWCWHTLPLPTPSPVHVWRLLWFGWVCRWCSGGDAVRW